MALRPAATALLSLACGGAFAGCGGDMNPALFGALGAVDKRHRPPSFLDAGGDDPSRTFRASFEPGPTSVAEGALMAPVRVVVRDSRGRPPSKEALIELKLEAPWTEPNNPPTWVADTKGGVATFGAVSVRIGGLGYRLVARAANMYVFPAVSSAPFDVTELRVTSFSSDRAVAALGEGVTLTWTTNGPPTAVTLTPASGNVTGSSQATVVPFADAVRHTPTAYGAVADMGFLGVVFTPALAAPLATGVVALCDDPADWLPDALAHDDDARAEYGRGVAASILGSIAADLRGDAAAVISSRDAVAASLDARAAVLEAAAELGDEIVRDFGGAGGWPAHVPTRDEVPLVRLAPISGVACAEELERTLADAVRASGFLHLVDPAGADAALELRGGVDLTGRFTVDLFDVVAGRVLVRARSRRFATLPAPTAPSAPAAAQEPAVLPPPDAPEPSPPAGRPPRRTS